MFSVAGLYSYLKWEENKQQVEAERKREELYARRREQLRSQGSSATGQNVEGSARTPVPPIPPTSPPSDTDDMWTEATRRKPFRLRFSLRTLIVAMTVAAVFFGLVRILGGPANTATILGFIAVTGLVIHALGYDPPQPVILGWWFVLVLYVLISILGAIWVALA